MTHISLSEGPPVELEANSHKYNYWYFLANDIYPRYNTLKPVVKPKGKKKLDFHIAHAAARKDVEREFGILKTLFAIMRGPARFWDQVLWYIMNACVIMHNMINENERGKDFDYSFYDFMGHLVHVQRREERVAWFINSYHAILNNDVHEDLQNNLIEEWWKWNGQQNH
jgi:hypothetical protein